MLAPTTGRRQAGIITSRQLSAVTFAARHTAGGAGDGAAEASATSVLEARGARTAVGIGAAKMAVAGRAGATPNQEVAGLRATGFEPGTGRAFRPGAASTTWARPRRADAGAGRACRPRRALRRTTTARLCDAAAATVLRSGWRAGAATILADPARDIGPALGGPTAPASGDTHAATALLAWRAWRRPRRTETKQGGDGAGDRSAKSAPGADRTGQGVEAVAVHGSPPRARQVASLHVRAVTAGAHGENYPFLARSWRATRTGTEAGPIDGGSIRSWSVERRRRLIRR